MLLVNVLFNNTISQLLLNLIFTNGNYFFVTEHK